MQLVRPTHLYLRHDSFTRIIVLLMLCTTMHCLCCMPCMAFDEKGLKPIDFAGEELHFDLKWQSIPAGTAVLKAVDNGDGTVTYTLTAKSLAFFDFFYPVRIKIESTVNGETGEVFRYYKHAKEGWGKARVREVLFDPKKGIAKRISLGKVVKTLKVPPGVQDPLSALYLYRIMASQGLEEFTAYITDGKRVIKSVVPVLDRKKIKTPAGTFECVLLRPTMEGVGGLFTKSKGAEVEVWMAQNQWRIPVRLKSKVKIGHFVSILTKIIGH